MTELDAIRDRHVPWTEDVDVPTYCAYERVRWPCDTATVLAALDEADAMYDDAVSLALSARKQAEAREARLREAARYVVQLGNQPGMDDDEWEQAMTALEAALASPEAET